MTKILAPIGITVLVVIAIVLGYTIIQQQRTPQQSVTSQVPADTQQNNQPTSVTDIESLLKRLAASDLSPEGKAKFFSDLKAVAKETNLLSVTNCRPNPNVLNIKKNSSFKITNEDNGPITLGIGKQEVIINSKSTVTVEANWEQGASGLHCGNSLVGIIYTI